VYQIENKMTENRAQQVTLNIKHLAEIANFKGITFNKGCNGLTGKCIEMPNASYTTR